MISKLLCVYVVRILVNWAVYAVQYICTYICMSDLHFRFFQTFDSLCLWYGYGTWKYVIFYFRIFLSRLDSSPRLSITSYCLNRCFFMREAWTLSVWTYKTTMDFKTRFFWSHISFVNVHTLFSLTFTCNIWNRSCYNLWWFTPSSSFNELLQHL